MKNLTFCICFAFMGFAIAPRGFGQEEAAAPVVEESGPEAGEESQGAPDIACDDPIYNFGERDQSETVEHTFTIRNAGDRVLDIKNVKTACGCTVANISKRQVPAGESTEVTARLNLKNRRGKQRKGITVESNDPDTPKYVLYMEGLSTSMVSIEPQRVYFGQIEGDAVRTSKVSVVSAMKEPLGIKSVEAQSEYFSAELETVEEGKTYNVTVTTVPPLPTQPIRGNVRVTTDNAKYPVVDIMCSATILDELMVAPNQIVMAERPDGVTRYVVIRPGRTKAFSVESVDAPDEDITVNITSMGQNGYQIRLDNVVASKELDGKVLKITTDVEKKKEIEIPFKIVGS